MKCEATVIDLSGFNSKTGKPMCNITLMEIDDHTQYRLIEFNQNALSKLSIGDVVTVKTGMDYRGNGYLSIIY